MLLLTNLELLYVDKYNNFEATKKQIVVYTVNSKYL